MLLRGTAQELTKLVRGKERKRTAVGESYLPDNRKKKVSNDVGARKVFDPGATRSKQGVCSPGQFRSYDKAAINV